MSLTQEISRLDYVPFLAELSGFTHEELIGRQPTEFLIRKDRERAGCRIGAGLAGVSQHAMEYTILRKDGGTVPVEILSRSIRFGGKMALLSIVRDITSRKKAEQELWDR